ncbi:MAG: hypothetical protein ACRDLB_09650 [Actinomycetota bacterium]
MRKLLPLLLLVFLACGSDDAGRSLTGVVIDIESSSLTEIESFTLKDLDKTYEIYIDPGRTYDFPLPHLSAHRAGADPVAVEVEERNGRLVALEISDA